MRIVAAILLVGSALVALARESGPVRVSRDDHGEAARQPSAQVRLVTLPLPSKPPTPSVDGDRPAPVADPTRASILRLLDVVDDTTRDALLRYWVKARYPLSDLPGFAWSGGRIRLSDDLSVQFHILARPGEMLLVDPSTEIHNLHGEEVNFAVPPGSYDVRFDAPREPGLYRYRCDVHNETLGWVLVTDVIR